jgi:putative ubiquitin-RnfH superfamily antitoxin RatB of RatAB toxin-antitoxin module
MPSVEVIYATLDQQKLIQIEVEEGTTIEQCIKQSGVLTEFPEIDLQACKVGIFSQIKPLTEIVKEGDRIEIYRPLIADPKAVRRKKAEQAKTKN